MSDSIYPATLEQKELLIIMPVYNEEESLPQVIADWHEIAEKFQGNIVAINDGSKDHSLAILRDLQSIHPHLIVVDRSNHGHGQSCLWGYEYAINQHYQWMFQTDSDGQTMAQEFYRVWERRQDHPFIFGHRPSRGDGEGRKIISLILSSLIYLLFFTWVKDSNVPFRLLNVDRAKKYIQAIPKDLFLANSFLAIILNIHEKIKWVPITFRPRLGGVPSVNWNRFFSLGLLVMIQFLKARKIIFSWEKEIPSSDFE